MVAIIVAGLLVILPIFIIPIIGIIQISKTKKMKFATIKGLRTLYIIYMCLLVQSAVGFVTDGEFPSTPLILAAICSAEYFPFKDAIKKRIEYNLNLPDSNDENR